ncbi:hypothetical protein FQR65_LT04216 [Abscondita terminalis]|nr:hypothetical protein FQR65_LT04216 [Abscondita terminalis]
MSCQAKKFSIFFKDKTYKFIVNVKDDTFLKVTALTALAEGDILFGTSSIYQNSQENLFIILNNSFGINSIEPNRKYLNFRPKNVIGLFLTYRGGNCTLQPVGINSFGKLSSAIAEFLKLENLK